MGRSGHRHGPSTEEADTCRLLVVDDDPDDRLLLSDLLEETLLPAISVTSCDGFEAALARLLSDDETFDVCLVDFRLGARTGLDLIEAARPGARATAFILMTGDHGREVDLAAQEAGASGYLVKGELSSPTLDRALRYAMQQTRQRVHAERLARRDALTGLANRAAIQEGLEAAARRAGQSGRRVAVCLLDLDGFKAVNDELGHLVGDELLVAVGAGLRSAARGRDLVGRLGGDEFVVVLEDLASEGDAVGCAERFLEAVGEAVAGCPGLEQHAGRVAASLGLAVHPGSVPRPGDLLGAADQAMYAAKRAGGAQVSLHRPDTPTQLRLGSTASVLQAIERREFSLRFQPQVDLDTGEVVGAEVLVRWTQNGRSERPGTFLSELERAGTIAELDLWVLAEALRWRASAPVGHGFRLAVNLSPVDLAASDFVPRALDLLAGDMDGVELELTETTIFPDRPDIQESLAALRACGVRLAIDDFGTVHGSLARLREHAVDTFKLDRSFAARLASSAQDAAVVEAMSVLAARLGMVLVAEGIESAEQAAAMRALGVRIGQGYHLGRPMPAETMRDWLGARAARRHAV